MVPSVVPQGPHEPGPAADPSSSETLLREAMSTLRAGFLLVDEEGRAVAEVDPALLELGIRELTPAALAELRRRAVDADGRPLAADYTPVLDAVFRDIPMQDVLLGFPVAGDGDLRLAAALEAAGVESPAPAAGEARYRWIRLNSRRLVVDGESRILVTAVDVTLVRQAEEKLREELSRREQLESVIEKERRRFSMVFEHMGDIVTVFDEQGDVLFGTPSSERVLGFPPGHREPGGILDLVHPDDRERAAAALAGVIDGSRGPTDAVILRVRTAWDEWRYMECVGVNMLAEPTVEGIVVTARDVTERHRLTLALEHAATHDQLTGLPNRAMFSEHLAAALARFERRESQVALCYLDIDGFKAVNDAYGHAIGDDLLVEIARRVRECLRPADVPSRLGGDEFALVLEDVDKPAAMNVARRLRDRLQSPYRLGEIDVECGASIGVAMAVRGDTPESWLARADAALYRAKRAGGRVVKAAVGGGS